MTWRFVEPEATEERPQEPNVPCPTYTPVPAEVTAMGWCWGGFGLTFIWGFANQVWGALAALTFILPYIGPLAYLGVAIWLGLRGHEMAWKAGRYADLAQFQAVMRTWNRAGAIVFWITAPLALLHYVAASTFFHALLMPLIQQLSSD